MDDLEPGERQRLEEQGLKIVEQPIAALDVQGDQIAALRTGGGRNSASTRSTRRSGSGTVPTSPAPSARSTTPRAR